MRSKANTALTAPLVLHHTRIYKRATKKIIIIYHSSLVKAAMNAARVCKLHNGVKKTPQFLLFSQAKGETKTIAHLSIAELCAFTIVNCGMKEKHVIRMCNEYSPQLYKLLYNCKLKNKEAY
jgi:hypothetical protein